MMEATGEYREHYQQRLGGMLAGELVKELIGLCDPLDEPLAVRDWKRDQVAHHLGSHITHLERLASRLFLLDRMMLSLCPTPDRTSVEVEHVGRVQMPGPRSLASILEALNRIQALANADPDGITARMPFAKTYPGMREADLPFLQLGFTRIIGAMQQIIREELTGKA